MTEFIGTLREMGQPIAAHILITVAALMLGLAIALPLTLWSARKPAVSRWCLGIANLVQTIPALALLALFYPLLLWLSALVGGGIPALGFLPALLALSLYAVLPILRNGVTGLKGLDPAVLEAAEGIGMTPWQKLWWVEVPLVTPVLMAGVRTAAVWTIGAATLSTTVGQASLGDPIFAGLQTQNWALVLAGCLCAAALALAADGVLGLIEQGIRWRQRGRIYLGLGVVAAILAVAAATMMPSARPVVIIGAKNFSEQYILARLIGARLENAGYSVRYREGLGSAVIYKALTGNDIDVYIDYAGTIWTNEMRRDDIQPRAIMLRTIGDWMKQSSGVRLVGPLGFENAYAFAMRETDAKKRGIASLTDLVAAAPSLRLGSDLEFLKRPEWAAVQSAYPLRFASTRSYSPTFMYRALESGAVDVISAFSSDGRIAADQLTILADPKGAVPSYDALLLVSPTRSQDQRFVKALEPLINSINVSVMREANYMVDRDQAKASPAQAARFLLQ